MSGSNNSSPQSRPFTSILILDFAGCHAPQQDGNPPYKAEHERVIVTPQGERFAVVRFGPASGRADFLWVATGSPPDKGGRGVGYHIGMQSDPSSKDEIHSGSALRWLVGLVRPRSILALERVTAVNRVLEVGDLVVPSRLQISPEPGPACVAGVPVSHDLHLRILDAVASGLPRRLFRRGTYRSSGLNVGAPAGAPPCNYESGVDLVGGEAGSITYALAGEIPLAVLCLVDRLAGQPEPVQALSTAALEEAVRRIVANPV